MKVEFHTNIDSCKQFMPKISGLSLAEINPAVDDLILVYSTRHTEVWLKVVRRKWRMESLTTGGSPVLQCELHLAMQQSIEDMDTHVRRALSGVYL